MPRWLATWWSCVSTASPISTLAARCDGRRVPAVVTCRAMWEGGHFDGSEEERRTILATALDLGAEFVDVEWRAVEGQATGVPFRDLIHRSPDRIVVSSHDFDSVPADLESRARAMRATGAATIKIAVLVNRLSQTLCLKSIASDGPAVVIGMGESGVASRLLAGRFGSRWTYAGHGAGARADPSASDDRRLRVQARDQRRRASSASSARTRCTRCLR